MANEQQGKTSDSGSGKDKAQAAKPSFAGLMRAWQWIALVVVVGAFILSEMLFQRAEGEDWRIYTAEDGLASNIVAALALAPNGTLWVGTESSGVSRFDGQAWTTFTVDDGLAGNQITAMAVDPDGSVWANTDGGLSRFDGQIWATYALGDGLTGGMGRAIVVDADGSVWVNTDSGIFCFDGEAWTVHTAADGLADSNVFGIAVAPEGGLWALTEHGVSRFDGEAWTTYAIDDRVAGRYIGSAIAVTPDGTLWVGTAGCGLARFDGQTWTTYALGDGPARFDGDVYAIAVVSDGTMWVGDGGSAYHFDGQTWTAYALDSQAALRGYDPSVHALAVDAQGRVWIAGRFNGLAVLDARASMSEESLRTWTDRRDTLHIALGAGAWVILMSICWSASRRLGLQRFWLQWVMANAVSLALLGAAIIYFAAEPPLLVELWAVAAALIVSYVAQWFVLQQRFGRALAMAALSLVIGCAVGVPLAMLAFERISWWAGQRPTEVWYQVVKNWLRNAMVMVVTSGAMIGALYGAITGIGLAWSLRSSAARASD